MASPRVPSAESLLGSPLHPLRMAEAVDLAASLVASRRRGYFAVANVHVMTEAVLNAPLRRALASAVAVVPDGMPLVWWLKMRGHRSQNRVYGPDFTLNLLKRADRSRWRVALFGGHPDALGAFTAFIRRRFPRVRLVASISPPFKPSFSSSDLASQSRALNRSRPDLVLVGLGAPKQEIWMASASVRLRAPVQAGVGASFDFLSGAKPQAPRWMMRLGFEWAFRLVTEPLRLWKRYLLLNPLFLVLVALQESGIVNLSRGRRP